MKKPISRTNSKIKKTKREDFKEYSIIYREVRKEMQSSYDEIEEKINLARKNQAIVEELPILLKAADNWFIEFDKKIRAIAKKKGLKLLDQSKPQIDTTDPV